jgi:NADH:ubiquinone oxidoreductase subunit D
MLGSWYLAELMDWTLDLIQFDRVDVGLSSYELVESTLLGYRQPLRSQLVVDVISIDLHRIGSHLIDPSSIGQSLIGLRWIGLRYDDLY